MVAMAGDRSSPESGGALASLCEAYWYPLYAYVRRRGYSPDDAEDLTQEFFTTLLEKQTLRVADRERGRFRTFLLTALSNFLSKERVRASAQKRGGGQLPLSLDFSSAEDWYSREPADQSTPERIYERRWALTVLDRVRQRVRRRYVDVGKERLFDHLKVFLSGEDDAPPVRQLAQELCMAEGAVKMAVHRLRERYREALRNEIARMVPDPAEVDDEINSLLAALQSDDSAAHV
ncbi:MAG: RNA polymerase subunit sigma-24 [Armatimonadetes bacterium CG_4_10_14_3_um_filter_66_18]|nr:sigma-70 family RNA polymerase sigma factor [Armatimonadota bacterium]PIU91549.1 MAG: RNA polymerase subunit sigma-24 [Armatimonadetes bacterium CG06_land_8_20_14_3_00_66_21]PIX50044.1 MAG: RNA polymerase subunit sigma-24 [Armatimonadetes bacterium CG_4_8_14_3_um_filter_66_20]PIY50882.1 MAG: RNA polymerase subunit sigma-24 [Armatimonadetes bacterium CG_4_10_14_3_um_filter_66_18]PIZ36969.1 MAG: RNA polymerase subunit sigma-24 [Armatimonadetes bacterium CG_4_10_14_0_8_um_filter_66_14]PJB60724